MCGAFEQHTKAMHRWAEVLTNWPLDVQERLDVRPTMSAGTLDASGYRVRSWSLIPAWAESPRLSYSTFNARAETVHSKPAFRSAWRNAQRCVIPVSAYFEWPVVSSAKQCHRVSALNGAPLFLAGLWDVWEGGDTKHDSFTVLTTPPIASINWVHHRMPLVLDAINVELWLKGTVEQASKLLSVHTSNQLRAEPFNIHRATTRDLFSE